MNRMRIAAGFVAMIAVVTAIPALAAGKSSPSVLNGVYRISWTQQQLIVAGASPVYARHNFGIDTLTLRDGRFRLHLASHPPDCNNGHYTVSGKTFTIDFRRTGCQGVVRATWSLHNSQLRLHVLRATDPGDEIFWGRKPWKKIG